ncbi:hypothetical protein CRV00_05740 [Malaciobacter molluscorum]|uniref:non-ribosomal peptide synthetase/type I polyketide synthase n=1 Tax=Malaciobacter molluscorum TaxID=1032072 RepID=UPI00100A78C1|nr:non-ribosomal peptide synthetase/type I polyketide synthase [Malaciobacter molluscorum]RXJ94833.1 hypothetical protein CRV00_05740 [Malaciobacter molluscorum]
MSSIYEPIAIIGTSCRLPGEVNNLDELWNNLSEHYDAIVDIPSKRALQDEVYNSTPQVGKSYAKKAGLINNIASFDAKFFGITDEEASSMDPQQRLLLEASWHALEDAALFQNDILLNNTGLSIGVSTDDYSQIGMHSHNLSEVNTYNFLGSFRSISAGRIAYHLGLNGPVSQVDTACSSSLMAIHQACQSLRLQEADCMLAGGISLLISPHPMVALSQIKALSLSNRCSVFDSSADGYVRGEGYGLVVLKRLNDAIEDKDNIIAVIRGSLANHDGASNGLTAPNGLAQEKLLEKTLNFSGIDSSDINYIETHGTGTLFGDPIEVNSIINIYGKNRSKDNPLFLGAIKSCIGHLEAAAGVAGVLKVCSSLKHKQLAPNLNFSTPNSYIKWEKAPIKVIDKLQYWNENNNLRTAAVSSFGLSGTNVHMIIQEYVKNERNLESNDPKDKLYFIPISAKTPTALKNLVNKWINASYLKNENMSKISFSAIKTRKNFYYKLLVLAKDYEDLIVKLKSWYDKEQNNFLWTNIDFEPLKDVAFLDQEYINTINNYFLNNNIDWNKLNDNNAMSYCQLPNYVFDSKDYWWDKPYNFNKKITKESSENKISYELKWEEYIFEKTLSKSFNNHIIYDNKEADIFKYLQNYSNSLSTNKEFLSKDISDDTNYIYIVDLEDSLDIFEDKILEVWTTLKYFNENNKTSKIWIITKNGQDIYKEDILNINTSAVWGLLRSLRLELNDSWGGIIDISQNLDDITINQVLKCISTQNTEDQYAIRNEKIYVPRLMPYNKTLIKLFSFDLKASYLITGGLGALGIALVEHLTSLGLEHIIIASRKGEETLNQNQKIKAKVDNWRKQGITIDIYSLDLSQKNQVEEFFKKLKNENIKLKGIAHLAGVVSKTDLNNNLNQKDINEFTSAKVKGAWYLHQYSKEFHLDFFLLFSSMTALFGMKGLAFYSASNAFLDSLAFYRNKQGLKSLAINWGRFDIDGMVDKQDSLVFDTLGISKLDTKKAFGQINQYLGKTNNVCIANIDWNKFTSYFKQIGNISLFTHLFPKTNDKETIKKVENKEQFYQYFIDIVSKTLKLNKDEISTKQNLFSIGLNSMLSMYIRQALEQSLNLKTKPTLFFKRQTIDLLVEYLWEEYENKNLNEKILDNKNKKITFLFSGQGTQYAGMGRTFYENDEEFKQIVDYCTNFLQKEFGLDLKSILFDEYSKLLKETKYSQVALFIIEYSLYKLWEREDIVADCFIGHSVGEYVAACISGVFSIEDALRLLKVRGELMQSLEGTGDMMVAFDSLEKLPKLFSSLCVAANNSPWQTVISGKLADLKEYEIQLSKDKIKAHFLDTKQAFHSKLMTPILDEFYNTANSIKYHEPKIQIISNLNGKEATENIASAKYWVDHIVNTVQFSPSIKKAYELGNRFFVEIGPGSVLRNLAEQNMIEKSVKCYYFNSLINEDNSKQYLQEEQEKLKELQKNLFNKEELIEKQTLLKPIFFNKEELFKPFPLTSMQHAYWLGRNKEVTGGGVAIHMYVELDISHFDKQRFINAWDLLIKRHDMLHALIDKNGQQKVLENIPKFSIFEDSLIQKSEEEKQIYLENVRDELSHQNVSLEKWPQFEIRISKFDDNKSRVHLSMDGWTIDGWSYQILFYELHQLYINPNFKLPTINISFRDYVLQIKKIEESDFYKEHLEKWKQRLEVLPKAPQLPTKKDQINKNRFKRWDYFIDKEGFSSLKKYASDKSLTIVTTLLSAYAWVLSRYSKEHNITINIPRFNRLPLHSDINRVVGEFASFTLLACTRDRDTTFIQYAKKIQKQLWEDVENPWVSGVTLLRELAKISKQPNVMMPYVFTNMPEETLDGKKLEFLNEWKGTADIPYFLTQTPQVQIDCQYHDKDEGLFIFWDVLIDKFEDNIIDDLFSTYINFLKDLYFSNKTWNEQSLNIQKSSLLISKEMKIPKQSLYEQFSQTVQNNKEKIAIYSENEAITYNQLYKKSQQLGAYLINNIDYTKQTPVVGVVMDKGWQQIVAVMGILASGAIFLPLDSNLPKDRLQYALENANAQMVLTKNTQFLDIKEKLNNSNIPLVSIDDKNIFETINKILKPKYEDLVCIIYTSGSTGLPKGVMIKQEGLVNSIVYTKSRFSIDKNDSFLTLTPLHHDMAFFDIFTALSSGASIVVPEDKKRKDPVHWLNLINDHNVSIWNSVPAMMEMLLKYTSTNEEESKNLLSSLRLSFLGGDWISLKIPTNLKKLNEKTTLVSVGGPTETTLWNIMYEIKEFNTNWRSVPYGKPIANTKYFILNNLLEECPAGITGELYVSGVGLAAGYINDLEKTQEVFITNPKTKERMYKTGDLGRILPSGEIEFMGRSDSQIQISGYRIELSELESLALKQKEIEKVQIFYIKDDKAPYIALVYTCNDKDITEEQLKKQLKESLPVEMIPKKLLKIESFPLTANGKIDRKALKQLVSNKNEHLKSIQNILENEVQKNLMKLWQKYLEREDIGLYENFFEAGGNSLLATELFIVMRERYPIIDSVVLLYEHTSIYELAQFIEKESTVNKEVKTNKRGLQRRKKLLAKN